MHEFNLEGNEYILLCDLLKRIGLCDTGGQAKNVIADSLVKVDGVTELRKRAKIRVDQVVDFAGEVVKVKG